MGALKSDFDSDQDFPDESSSQMVYKVLYADSFTVYIIIIIIYDQCLVNIVILYHM